VGVRGSGVVLLFRVALLEGFAGMRDWMVDVVTKTSDADTIRDKEAVIKNSLARIEVVTVKAMSLPASTRVANDSKIIHAQHQFAADKETRTATPVYRS